MSEPLSLPPKWYTVAQVAQLLGYGESKVRMLIIAGDLPSLKDGRCATSCWPGSDGPKRLDRLTVQDVQLSMSELKPAVSAGIRPGPCHRAPCAAVRGELLTRNVAVLVPVPRPKRAKAVSLPTMLIALAATAATKPSLFSGQRPVPNRHDRRLHHQRSARRTPARRHS